VKAMVGASLHYAFCYASGSFMDKIVMRFVILVFH
jgi:hypothetical protein